MKALVLAGGRGRRLGVLSDAVNKCLIRVAGRPVIENGLRSAASVAEEIIVVVGYRGDEIVSRYGASFEGTPVRYAVQAPLQLGLVHAIECAAPSLEGDDFVLLLGDVCVTAPRYVQMTQHFRSRPLMGVCGVLRVDDVSRIRKTFTIATGSGRSIVKIVEKPDAPFNDWMGTGEGVFRNDILDLIPRTPVHPLRGERELAGLVQHAIDDGHQVDYFEVCAEYRNINSASDLDGADESGSGARSDQP